MNVFKHSKAFRTDRPVDGNRYWFALPASWLLMAVIAGGLNLAAPSVQAEDWPHWMGPARNNTWEPARPLDTLPADGLKVVWRVPVAGGYSGPAVVGKRMYVSDYVTKDDVKIANFERNPSTGTERFFCLDAETGKELWKQEVAVRYDISYPAGPRCTPVVDRGRVTFLGAEGALLCCDAESGKILWQKDLPKDYKTKTALWGYSSHPLVDGDKLICVVGGAGSHTVAFDVATGKELWKYGTATEQGYSPPTIIEAAGKRQLILMSPSWIASVDPETGKEYWQESYEANNGSIIMTPLKIGKYLFVGGYEKRSLMLELAQDKPGAKVLWRDKRNVAISPVNVQPFLEGEILYGFDGTGELMAMEVPSGKRLWETPEPLDKKRPKGTGSGFFVKQGNRYFMFLETGELAIVELSPKGFKELARSKVLEPTNNAFGRPVVWCAPAFANGRMYVRNDAECVCVELSKQG